MAGRIKQTESKKEGKVITFDNKKDYRAIKLLSDGKIYVEHNHFADSLVAKKLAEEVKGVELEDVEPGTKEV